MQNALSDRPIAAPGAVAIIEAPDHFIAEGRPNTPGRLAHSGKVQLFGGHVEEAPGDTIRRELGEELGLVLEEAPPLLWSGEVESQNKHGEPVRRQVSLFRVSIGATTELNMKVSGELIRIPKTLEAVEAHRIDLPPLRSRHCIEP